MNSDGTFVPPESPVPPTDDEVARQIASAASWVRFLSILGFIGMGFMALAGLILLVLNLPIYGGAGRLVGFMYLVIAGIYLYPLLPLNRLAGASEKLRTERQHDMVVQAVTQQATFWKRFGILTIVAFVLGIVSAIIAGVAAVMATV